MVVETPPPLLGSVEWMTNFGQFYQQGGVFMHLITLFALASTGLLAARAVRLRRLVRRVTSGTPPPPPEHEGLILGLMVAAGLAGALGATFGLIETCAALQTVPPEHHVRAVTRAIPLALSPFAWSLMLVTPLVLGRAVVGTLEARLRGLAARV
ncbi:MAG: hypothetical protein ACRBN8_17465 [Nannocystales bacterium]